MVVVVEGSTVQMNPLIASRLFSSISQAEKYEHSVHIRAVLTSRALPILNDNHKMHFIKGGMPTYI